MTTIKSYTDIEQSKVLAEILPHESADMWWSRCTITDFGDGVLKVSYAVEPCNISQFRNTKEDIPCWSLVALLSVIPKPDLIQNSEGTWMAHSWINAYPWSAGGYSNPVDSCYKLILKLNQHKML